MQQLLGDGGKAVAGLCLFRLHKGISIALLIIMVAP